MNICLFAMTLLSFLSIYIDPLKKHFEFPPWSNCVIMIEILVMVLNMLNANSWINATWIYESIEQNNEETQPQPWKAYMLMVISMLNFLNLTAFFVVGILPPKN